MSLRVENGSFAYGDRVLFSDICIDLDRTGVMTVLGPNGAGKTTFLRCMMGFIPWRNGASYLDGMDIKTLGPKNVARRIAYVPQNRSKSFDYTVHDTVLMGRSPYIGLMEDPGKEDDEVVERCLVRLGLEGIADRTFNTLSGGEMQLVTIARALAAEPEIMVMDEPETNLDYSNQLMVMGLIEEMSEDMLCVMNTHYPDHALRVSDTTLLLDGHGGYSYGPTCDIITEENLASAFSVDAIVGNVSKGGREYGYIVPIGRRR